MRVLQRLFNGTFSFWFQHHTLQQRSSGPPEQDARTHHTGVVQHQQRILRQQRRQVAELMIAHLPRTVHEQVAGIALGQGVPRNAFFGQVVGVVLDTEFVGVHGA